MPWLILMKNMESRRPTLEWTLKIYQDYLLGYSNYCLSVWNNQIYERKVHNGDCLRPLIWNSNDLVEVVAIVDFDIRYGW
jgi:hypothetical protein